MSQQSLLVAVSALIATALAQVPGTYTPEVHPKLSSFSCTRLGGCKTLDTSVVLDSNYRWLHNVGGYDACAPDGFNTTYCPDITSCAKNCALEGVNYTSTGVTTSGDSITLNLFTNSPRLYMLANETTYEKYMLMGKEFTYDVDVSAVPCGVNGALYFSEMSANGDASALNTAGAKYGTGYCDAQCPKNSFVKGQVSRDSRASCYPTKSPSRRT